MLWRVCTLLLSLHFLLPPASLLRDGNWNAFFLRVTHGVDSSCRSVKTGGDCVVLLVRSLLSGAVFGASNTSWCCCVAFCQVTKRAWRNTSHGRAVRPCCRRPSALPACCSPFLVICLFFYRVPRLCAHFSLVCAAGPSWPAADLHMHGWDTCVGSLGCLLRRIAHRCTDV